MQMIDGKRTFFILYNNGLTFYFTVDNEGKIYCNEFNNLYIKTTGESMTAAFSIEITEDDIILRNIEGKTIYSLKIYQNTLNYLTKNTEEKLVIEKLYIDEDVNEELTKTGKLSYEEVLNTYPDLLYKDENPYIRKRCR